MEITTRGEGAMSIAFSDPQQPPLSLQGIELDLDTPADLYRSGNSVYTCVVMSSFSIAC